MLIVAYIVWVRYVTEVVLPNNTVGQVEKEIVKDVIKVEEEIVKDVEQVEEEIVEVEKEIFSDVKKIFGGGGR